MLKHFKRRERVALFALCVLMLTPVACDARDTAAPDITDGETAATDATGGGKTASYRKISAKAAYALLKAKPDCLLLDVRTEEEFREKHIEGALLIPDDEIGQRAETELSDKDAYILVYCRSGRRSELAARELIAIGYTHVYDFGGLIDWPYETVSD